MAAFEISRGAGARVFASQDSDHDSKSRDETRLVMGAGVESSLQDLDDWMREDEATCSGSDREVDTRMIDLEGVDAGNTFSRSDSGLTFMHEDTSEGTVGEVGVIGRMDMGSGTLIRQEGTRDTVSGWINDVGEDNALSGSDSGTKAVHETTSEVIRGIESKVGGVIESMDSGSGLSSLSIAESANVFRDSECEGEWENKEGTQLSDVR